MKKINIVGLISQVEIFKDLPLELLNELGSMLNTTSFMEHQSIIKKGEEGDSMFIIGTGKVKVHDESHTIAVLETGNFFGEFSLLDAAPRSMTVTALEPVTVVGITRNLFYNLLNKQPEVAKKIISALTSRLRNQNHAIIQQLKTREQELTRLVEERTIELKHKNDEVLIKNKEITDNMQYAKRIQSAILPDVSLINQTFKQAFVLYLPKDIVSGDFFSFFRQNNSAIIAAADCTGHGVTGAFLSVIGNSLLNKLINEKKLNVPAEILDNLNEEIIGVLNQRISESNDGMDIAVCNIDLEKKQLRYAGANRPLWIIRHNELMVQVPDKFPIGGLQIIHEHAYTDHMINLEDNDALYIFTDGFADQFGGEKHKKLMTAKFKEILLSIQELSMPDQEKYLKSFFEKWKGPDEQVDDVLVIGIRI